MKITDSGPFVTVDAIKSFEAKIKIKLPHDYREFLIKHNGGCPYPSSFKVDDGLKVSVSRLLSLGGTRSFDSLDDQYESDAWKDALRHGVIKIGYDPGGQEIMLATSGDIAGSVYLIVENDAHLLASSFAEFMQKMEGGDGIEPDAYDELMQRVLGRQK